MNLEFSLHAAARIRQRGLRERDVDAIVEAGSATHGDSVLLTAQDVDREILRRKGEIAQLERLRGCRVVMSGSTIITVYRTSRKTEKRLLRSARRHGS